MDKLVVLYCHHDLASMTAITTTSGTGRAPRVPLGRTGGQLKALLLRFPNVVALVNGHTHANNIWRHAVDFGGGNRNGF